MLQISQIEEEKDRIVHALAKRRMTDIGTQLEQIVRWNETRKHTQQQLDNVLAEANQLAREIGSLFKSGRQEEAAAAKSRAAALKEESKTLQSALKEVSEKIDEALFQIPNAPHVQVPEGSSEADNIQLKISVDDLPELPEAASLPHWELIEKYDLIDFELGTKITGAGFPVYKGKGARMVRGMVNYFLDQAIEAGYQEVQTPLLVNEDSGKGTGQLPDKEGQMYQVTADNLFLIPTAEVPITNIYRGDIIATDRLPIKNCGYTPCFRREAGSWGAHVRGLNRLHQFDKVELVQIVAPEDSYKVLDEMVTHVEKLIRSLGLPYRILRLCAGDLGFAAAMTIDFEVYSAAQQKWLEVSSVSNFESFQANRLKLKYKTKTGEKGFLHTLNGSGLAVPRILAAILENNQTAEGIDIPEVLQPYVGFSTIAH